MPLVEFPIAPGIVTEATERGAKGRWRNGNRVRFRQDLPQKIGGWRAKPLAGETMVGVPRAAHDWQAINGEQITAVGTNLRLYHAYGGTLVNITPYRLATDDFGGSDPELTDPFSTTSGSAVVDVAHTSHGLTEGATVYFANATAVGGITVDGEYTVTTVGGGNSYQITHTSNATSTAGPGGGTVDYAYEINVGSSSGNVGLGFGAGPYGEGTYGTARESSDILIVPRSWALDTWGEDLVANPRHSGIYYWDKSGGFSDNRATLIHANAPSNAAFVVVSPVDRHLIALGCTPIGGSSRDPLTIRWSSQNDFTDWSPTRVNTSGQRRLDGGSEILSGLRTREEILVFTDVPLYAMTFVGPPQIFHIREIGTGGGLAGPLARTEFRGAAWWMSYEDFFYYDGAMRVLPCPVRNHVFDDLNRTQVDKFFAGVNTLYQEVWFFYCSADSMEIDRYALVNVEEGHWSIGELERTAWLDQSAVRTKPAAFDAAGTLYDHETGASAAGDAMGEFLESWDAEVPGPNGEPAGDHLLFLRRLVPDFLEMTGPMEVTLKGRKYPHGEQITKGPFEVATSDGFIRPRIRCRQTSLFFQSKQSIVETHWRMGTWRVDARPHGRR